MEILEYIFFLFWAAISAIFLKLTFNTIDNTELSKSASPLVMFLFKHSSAMFTCYSSNHALCRSRSNKPVGSNLHFFITGIAILVFLTRGSVPYCYLPIYVVTSQYHLFMKASNDGRFSSKWKLVLYACYIIATAFVSVVAFYRKNFNGHAKTLTMMAVVGQNILPIIVSEYGRFSCKWKLLGYACYIIAIAFTFDPAAFGRTNVKGYAAYAKTLMMFFCDYLCLPAFFLLPDEDGEGESLLTIDPVHDPNLINDDNKYYKILFKKRKYHKIKKSVEFAVGLLGTILFQNFFKLNSFKEVVVFLYFAVVWLANITMLSASHDLGVFNFLLANAIVGCSVSEFGLRGKTWIAYAASLFLYCLRLKLQSLPSDRLNSCTFYNSKSNARLRDQAPNSLELQFPPEF